MDLITLLVLVVVFVAVVWGGFYVCDRAGFPQPVRWIWGAICLIVLLYFLVGRIDGSGAFLHRPL
jgi:Na+/H+ antiporter NhaC